MIPDRRLLGFEARHLVDLDYFGEVVESLFSVAVDNDLSRAERWHRALDESEEELDFG